MKKAALEFISRRQSPLSITNSRITAILSYVITCYQKKVTEQVTYSKTWVKDNTAHNFEDYLKMELVDKYLIPNKSTLKKSIPQLEEINFVYETQKRYTDSSNIERVDKIDIYINKVGLQKVWSSPDEHIYFAIECKRLSNLSDCSEYLVDIEKFCLRQYKELRLPFESMIGFVESDKLTSTAIKCEINERLKKSTSITTEKLLDAYQLVKDFDNTFISNHKRSTTNEPFYVYHILLNYSSIVIE